MYDIFTDGSCINNPGPGGWAAIIIESSEKKQVIHGGSAYTTNNRMEMAAVLYALSSTPEGAVGTIYSDSQYVVNGATSWAKDWERNGWKKKDGSIPLNIDLWKEILVLTQKRKFNFAWVKGHDGNDLNEQCDSLAQNESKTFASVKGKHTKEYDCEKQFEKGIYDVSKAFSKTYEEKKADVEKKGNDNAPKKAAQNTAKKQKSDKSEKKKANKTSPVSNNAFLTEVIKRISLCGDFKVDLNKSTVSCRWDNIRRLQDVLSILGLKFGKDYNVTANKDGMQIKIML